MFIFGACLWRGGALTMVITAITFFVIKQHVHTCTEGINNRNKNVLFKPTFAATYSLVFSLLATGLD